MFINGLFMRRKCLIQVIQLLACIPALFAYAVANAGSDSIKLQISGLPQFQFAGFYVAQEKGFYRDEKIELQIIPGTKNNQTLIQNVLDQKADFGIGNASLALASLEGKRITVVADIFQKSANVLLTKPQIGNELFTLKEGQLILQSVTQVPEIYAYLMGQGLSFRDVEHIDVKDEINPVSDFVSGKARAISISLLDDFFVREKMQTPFSIVNPSNLGVNFYGDSLFTTTDFAQQNANLVQRFVSASVRGWKYALDNPDYAIEVLLKTEQIKRNAAELKIEAEQVRELIGAQTRPIGEINLERWQRIAQFYLQTNLVSPVKTLSPHFVFNEHPNSSVASSLFSSPITYVLIALFLFGGFLYLHAKTKRKTAEATLDTPDLPQAQTLDPIEVISSRHSLLSNLKQAVHRADQSKAHFILFFIEFGNLRELLKANEGLSEKLILTAFTMRIKEGLMEGDILTRQAQDEFALIVGWVDSAVVALEVVEALRTRIQAPLLINNVAVMLSIRMGFAVYQVDADTSEELMKIAARGMFREKFQSLY